MSGVKVTFQNQVKNGHAVLSKRWEIIIIIIIIIII